MTCATPLPDKKPHAMYYLSQPVRHSLPVRVLRATWAGQWLLRVTASKRRRNRVAQVSLAVGLLITAALGWDYFYPLASVIAVTLLTGLLCREGKTMAGKI